MARQPAQSMCETKNIRGDRGALYCAGFECLTEDLEEIMGLFTELLLTPALPQDKLDLAKAQVGQDCFNTGFERADAQRHCEFNPFGSCRMSREHCCFG